MDLLPTSVGTRPRLACELRPEGVVAARGTSPDGVLTALAQAPLPAGALVPGLKAGNLPNRQVVLAALRRSLDTLATRGAERSRYITVIVPDLCARVLLLDFDTLPSRLADALPIVRFRLKKLLPFDVDHALVSFQIMRSERNLLRVLAVAIPNEVLAEYESLVIEAGLQPGVVLPSTLAALAGLDLTDPTALVLNSAAGCLTTAIVHSGTLLLHRMIDTAESAPDLLTPPQQLSADLLTAGALASQADAAVALLNLAPDADNHSRDLAEAVSVAAAYFEDTLATPPATLLTAGLTSAHALSVTLERHGLDTLRTRELLSPAAFGPGTSTTQIPPGLLAGLRGALRS